MFFEVARRWEWRDFWLNEKVWLKGEEKGWRLDLNFFVIGKKLSFHFSSTLVETSSAGFLGPDCYGQDIRSRWIFWEKKMDYDKGNFTFFFSGYEWMFWMKWKQNKTKKGLKQWECNINKCNCWKHWNEYQPAFSEQKEIWSRLRNPDKEFTFQYQSG